MEVWIFFSIFITLLKYLQYKYAFMKCVVYLQDTFLFLEIFILFQKIIFPCAESFVTKKVVAF